MITTFYPPYSFGGDAMYIYRLSNELAKRGHFVDVIHCEDSYSILQKNSDLSNFPNHANIKVIRLKSRAGFLSPLLSQQTGIPFFKPELKNALVNNKYDVIHYHNISLIGISALSYGSAAVKLYTTHEHWLICPMHVLWKFNREVCTKKECTRCQLLGKRPPQLWRHTGMMESNIKNIDYFISPSQFTLEKHLEEGLNIAIEHIPYFLPTPTEITEVIKIRRRPYFLFVGRLEKIKGLQNLIPIFKANPKYNLLVAGEGPYKTELLSQSKNFPNIDFLGKMSQNQLKDIYQQAVAVIVPSICYETFGIITIEAFAMKTPVIVNNLGALPEPVKISGGGFIYSNESELVEAIRKLSENPELRKDLGNKGYQGFLKYWSEDAHIEQYYNLIKKVQRKRITNQ